MSTEEDNLVQVIFQPYGIRVTIERWKTVLEAAQKARLDIRNICGGKGKCGKCKVIISSGKALALSDRTSTRYFFTTHEVDLGYHLACQTVIADDLEVEIPLESRTGGQKILSWTTLPKIDLNPSTVKIFISPPFKETNVPSPKLSKAWRYVIKEVLEGSRSSDDPSVYGLRELFRKNAGATVYVRDEGEYMEIVDFEEEDTSHQSYGLAVDIGTTKVVTYLIDLNNGEVKDVESEYNGQLIYGEDLLSRIDYAYRRKDGLRALQKAVTDSIQYTVREITDRNRIRARDIIDACVAGNTVMTFLFIGEDPSNLVESDIKVERSPFKIPAKNFNLDINPASNVYCLPSVSRFVGGDAVADVLTSGMFEKPEISILVDMGTNGEIIIGSQGWLLSTSCAAGPAFEGWEIKFGMRSVEGAVEKVTINRDTLRASYSVIGEQGTKPKGICGSGLIDSVASMYTAGILDNLGKIRKDLQSPFLREGPDGYEYVIVPQKENELGKDIVLTQKDVDNLLDSKAAVCGAISVLMKKVGITIYDVNTLYLAGAFGTYINSKSATTIGIFPELPNAKTVRIGNGSVAGAALALLSTEMRRKAEKIAQTMTYYDLTTDPSFMEEYSAALYLPGSKELFPSRS